MKNDVEIYLEVLGTELHLYTQTALADFFEVKQPTLFGWIQRNSIKTLRKYIHNKNLDIKKIDEAVKNKQKILEHLSEKRETFLQNESERVENIREAVNDVKQNIILSNNDYSINFQYSFFNKFDDIKDLILDGFMDILDENQKNNEEVINDIERELRQLLDSIVKKDLQRIFKRT